MTDAPEPTPAPQTPRSNGRLIGKLVAIVAAAFGFGFAMVPLYDVLCEATGFNGKTRGGIQAGGLAADGKVQAPASRIDTTRVVTVEFTGTVMPGLPWEMRPLTTTLEIHPGEMHQVKYLVHNASNQTIVGQAVPSVSPGQAAQHFEKLDCFCFKQQTMAPGETREMPLTFIVKPEIDAKIRTVTLSYAFFKAPEKSVLNERE